VSQKKLPNCFCPNFVKFPQTLIIFGVLIAQRMNLCEVQLFSTSPNSRQRLTMLNADVANFYITVVQNCYIKSASNLGTPFKMRGFYYCRPI